MIDERQRGIRACIQIHPGDESRIFRLGAADDILRILIDAQETEFTLKELGRETDYSRSTVWRALELLTELDIIQIRETTQRKYSADILQLRVLSAFCWRRDPVGQRISHYRH
jgi:DNA-binding IclR family transcriptional regulator